MHIKTKLTTCSALASHTLHGEGVKNMMGMQSKKRATSLNGKNGLDFSNELSVNNHFNVHDFSEKVSVFKNVDFNPVHNNVSIDKVMVLKLFQGVKERKSLGLDGMGGRVQKTVCCRWQTSSASFFRCPYSHIRSRFFGRTPNIQTPKDTQ